MSTRTETEFLEEENAKLRDLVTGTRERLENLAIALNLSAETTQPSKKSDIEQGCALAVLMIAESLGAGLEG